MLGVLFALAQHDLKRLLAYHSVENIGIILLGIGLGVLGLAHGMTTLAVIGFAAGLLHVLNHSIFKGLLFLGAGAVQHAAHSLELEELGGLLKRMPWTGTTFLIGAAAIVGLPPLNGFVSEFLLFYAGFLGLVQPTVNIAVAGLIALVAMGLISGLAAACFAKAFGIVFLGSARSHEARRGARSGLADVRRDGGPGAVVRGDRPRRAGGRVVAGERRRRGERARQRPRCAHRSRRSPPR